MIQQTGAAKCAVIGNGAGHECIGAVEQRAPQTLRQAAETSGEMVTLD
jgi:hypothetical protein